MEFDEMGTEKVDSGTHKVFETMNGLIDLSTVWFDIENRMKTLEESYKEMIDYDRLKEN